MNNRKPVEIILFTLKVSFLYCAMNFIEEILKPRSNDEPTPQIEERSIQIPKLMLPNVNKLSFNPINDNTNGIEY